MTPFRGLVTWGCDPVFFGKITRIAKGGVLTGQGRIRIFDLILHILDFGSELHHIFYIHNGVYMQIKRLGFFFGFRGKLKIYIVSRRRRINIPAKQPASPAAHQPPPLRGGRHKPVL